MWYTDTASTQGWESQPKDDTFSECAHKGLAGNLTNTYCKNLAHTMSVFKNRSIRLQTSENLIEV